MKKNELDGRSKVKHNKLNFIIFLAICSFIIVYQFYKMKDPRNIRANKDINSKSQMQVGTKESHNILNTQEYVVSLEKFGITTDGNNAIKTSIGINKALQ